MSTKLGDHQFNIFTPDSHQALAVVAYGWESKAFYADWFGRYDPDIIQQMQDPILNPNSPQSELAPALVQLVRYVLQDEEYVARLKRHYRLFKQKVTTKPVILLGIVHDDQSLKQRSVSVENNGMLAYCWLTQRSE